MIDVENIKEIFTNFKVGTKKSFENLKENKLVSKIIENPNLFILGAIGTAVAIASRSNTSEKPKNARIIFNYFKEKKIIDTNKTFDECKIFDETRIKQVIKNNPEFKNQIPHVDFIIWAEDAKLILIEAKSRSKISKVEDHLEKKFKYSQYFVMYLEKSRNYEYIDLKAIIFKGKFLKNQNLAIDKDHKIYKIPPGKKRRKIRESDYYILDGDYVYGFKATNKGIIDKNTLA